MMNRRLLVLFFLFGAGFILLALRLGQLQISQAAAWQEEMRSFVHRTHLIETTRGAIVDRNGAILAHDISCWNLAIDYRAMNLDNRWITATALRRLKEETAAQNGGKLADRAARIERLAEIKAEIARQIDAIPQAVATVCHLAPEDVYQRFNNIRARIQALREDRWSRPYNKDDKSADDDDDASDPSVNPDIVLKEEVVAHTIVADIPDAVAFYFLQHKAEYPGLVVIDSRRREYPFKDVAAQVIGNMRSIDADTLKDDPFRWPANVNAPAGGNLAGYLPGDDMGENGVEKLMEPQLRGTRGMKVVDLGAASGDASDVADPPVPGATVRLTLDARLQSELQSAIISKDLLRGADGKDHFVAVVVMGMDGQVLAMVSLPTYDLNRVDELRPALLRDEYRRPMANRTLQRDPPGSTVKPLIASAALTEGVITPETTIVCNGYLFPGRPDIFRCAIYQEAGIGHGPLQLEQAIEESCNIYFYTTGRNLGLARLERWFDAYGFGRDSGFELPEQDGHITHAASITDPAVAVREATMEGIGQGSFGVTPLQMAKAYATLLRAGDPVRPHILLDTHEKPLPRRIILSADTVAVIRRGMELVTHGSKGTARSIFAGMRLAVAGKTGTADTTLPTYDANGQPVVEPVLGPDGKPRLGADGKPLTHTVSQKGTDAWFVGYAPMDQPKYVIAAEMEFGGYGGARAAPLVKEAFLQLERHGYLPALDVPSPPPAADPGSAQP